eukprot:235962-Rhodomonas_salina.1
MIVCEDSSHVGAREDNDRACTPHPSINSLAYLRILHRTTTQNSGQPVQVSVRCQIPASLLAASSESSSTMP